MLRMDQVHVVRHKILVEGRSILTVSRQMSISRNTIRKYLKVSEPVRVTRQKKPSPVMEMISPRVDEIVEEWRDRTTPKQRITGTRIHRQLVEEGYQVGLTTVRSYLREKRRQRAEVFVPLAHHPGEEAQVDFFDVTVEEDGQEEGVEIRDAAHVLRKGLREALRQLRPAFLPGRPREGFRLPRWGPTEDRLRQPLGGRQEDRRERAGAHRTVHGFVQPLPLRAMLHPPSRRTRQRWRGSSRKGHTACPPHPNPQGQTLSEISEVLLGEVKMAFTSVQRFAEERQHLRKLPESLFEARRVELASVSRRSTVRIEGATYSVPSHWASLRATAYVGVEDVPSTAAAGGDLPQRAQGDAEDPLPPLPLRARQKA